MKLIIRIIGAVVLLAMLLVNWLASRGVIAGVTTGEISAKYPVLLTPASYAFSIWLVIYSGLIAYVIYSFTRSGMKEIVVDRIGIYFVLSSIFNLSWIILWQYELLMSSLFVMYALFISLLGIYMIINEGQKGSSNWTAANKFLITLPFTLYIAWISIAMIINTAIVLKYGIWNIQADLIVSIVLLVIALLIAYWLGFRNNHISYLLVIVWALIAIAVKQYSERAMLIVTLAGLIIVLVCLWISLALVLKGKVNS